MDEVTDSLSVDLNVITAEINSYKQVAGNAIFEIGRRLKHVHEKKLAEKRGGWTTWLREIGMSTSQADRFIKVHDRLGDGKFPMSGSMALGILYEIATLPEEARDQTHTITSTGEVKTVDEMTVRELREVKKALREAQEAASRAQRRAQKAEEAVRHAKNTERALRGSIEELRKREPEIEYIEDDKVRAELERYKCRFGDIDLYEDDGVKRVTSETEVSATAIRFSSDVMEFIKQYAFLQNYKDELSSTNAIARDKYINALNSLADFVDNVRENVNVTCGIRKMIA